MTSSLETPLTTHLHQMFTMTDAWLRRNVEGLTAEQAMARPTEGNSIAWIVGHVVYWRQAILKMAGGEPVWADGEAEGFKGTSRTNPVSVDKSWDALLAAYQDTHARLVARLNGDLALASRALAPGSELWGTLAKLHCHEAYHVGQIGLARRALGLPGAI